jgi:hypothetical protein
MVTDVEEREGGGGVASLSSRASECSPSNYQRVSTQGCGRDLSALAPRVSSKVAASAPILSGLSEMAWSSLSSLRLK